MKKFPSVEIILSSSGRFPHIRNTIEGWSDLTYPNYKFTLIDNGSNEPERLRATREEFSSRISNFQLERIDEKIINQVWNYAGKRSDADYVIFAMADEIISMKDIVQKMLACPSDRRCSVNTYFLSQEMTAYMPTLEWKTNPKIFETLPGFWDGEYYQRYPNRERKSAGILSHITGQSRANWEWFGWFIDEPNGHLWIDQNVHLREVCLGKGCETVSDAVCYHQWHPPMDISHKDGYFYETEGQARLLEPGLIDDPQRRNK
jgi:hypothetical protein